MCFEQFLGVLQTLGLILVGAVQAVFAGLLYKVAKSQNAISNKQAEIMDNQKIIAERQMEFYELWASIEQLERQINQRMRDYEKLGKAQNTDVGVGMLNEISNKMLPLRKTLQEKLEKFMEKYHTAKS